MVDNSYQGVRWGAADKKGLAQMLVVVELNWVREVDRKHQRVAFLGGHRQARRRPE